MLDDVRCRSSVTRCHQSLITVTTILFLGHFGPFPMPRIPHSLLLRAHEISPFLPLVLRATRTLPSALNELRWLAEHVQEQSYPRSLSNSQRSRKLLQLCKRRERGEPLQYILGSQPFGELDIKCRPGVLIPR